MICLKCLEKEPELRYGSVETLANDLERWMRHEPPLHVPIRKRDRQRIWSKRNPLFTGLTVTVMATLVLVLMAAGVVHRSQKLALKETLKEIERDRDRIKDSKRMQAHREPAPRG